MPKPSIELNYIPENNERPTNKNKIKTQGKGYSQPVTKTNNSTRAGEPHIEINIEVDGQIRTFQKMEDSSLNQETWAVIIADSVEKQKLNKYEQLLSNGTIGGSIRPLRGWSDRYEIGTTMDSRLIGKTYDTGIYHSLQRFMRMEDALQFSLELEKNGILDNSSLIVFSAEAKTHKDIARVASKL